MHEKAESLRQLPLLPRSLQSVLQSQLPAGAEVSSRQVIVAVLAGFDEHWVYGLGGTSAVSQMEGLLSRSDISVFNRLYLKADIQVVRVLVWGF